MNDYELKFNSSHFCDLKFLKVREGPVEKWSDPLYGIPINTAIRHIATHRTCKKFEETDMIEFLKVWKEELKIAEKEVWELKKSIDCPKT